MMNTYANGTAALKMPCSYVPLSEEEMTYVDGGISLSCFWVSCAIDAVIGLATMGLNNIASLASKEGKRVLKKKWSTIAAKVAGITKVMNKVGNANTFLGIVNKIGNGLDTYGYWLNFTSIGGIVAYGIDCFDKNRFNESIDL